jgi:hypothetical protein
MAHSSVTSHSSPDPSPSPSVSTFSCKTKCQTTEGTISMRSMCHLSVSSHQNLQPPKATLQTAQCTVTEVNWKLKQPSVQLPR